MLRSLAFRFSLALPDASDSVVRADFLFAVEIVTFFLLAFFVCWADHEKFDAEFKPDAQSAGKPAVASFKVRLTNGVLSCCFDRARALDASAASEAVSSAARAGGRAAFVV